jgi:hypothetical protein
MKTTLKLIGLACLAASSLNAASFLVLIQTNYNNAYLRAETGGGSGRFLVADQATYTSPEIRFIIEDTWWGTPWLEAGDPFWIRSEMNNLYWNAGDHYDEFHIRVNQSAPHAGGTGAFKLTNRLDYGGVSPIKPNHIIWPNNYLVFAKYIGNGNWSQSDNEIRHTAGYSPIEGLKDFRFTILAVMQ